MYLACHQIGLRTVQPHDPARFGVPPGHVRSTNEAVMTKNRERRGFLSPRRIVFGALTLIGGVAVAVVYGGFGEVGRAIVRHSQTIQHEIDVLQQGVEDWIRTQLRPERRASVERSDQARQCWDQAMRVMPSEGLPGFLESKRHCLTDAEGPNAL